MKIRLLKTRLWTWLATVSSYVFRSWRTHRQLLSPFNSILLTSQPQFESDETCYRIQQLKVSTLASLLYLRIQYKQNDNRHLLQRSRGEQNKGVEGSTGGYLVYAWLNSGTGDMLGNRNTLDHGHIKSVYKWIYT